ncbi:MAG: hypothetical protein HQL07_11770 [Nitrospirae bacterium]|nr:hypothetical protein [Magnetococcales bacterium]
MKKILHNSWFMVWGIVGLLFLVIVGVRRVDGYVEKFHRRALDQLQMLGQVQYLANQLSQARLVKRPGDDGQSGFAINALLPWLEREIRRMGLIDKVSQISPLISAMDEVSPFRQSAMVMMKGLTMVDAVGFIAVIEKEASLRIARGDLKRSGEEQPGVDVLLEIGLL